MEFVHSDVVEPADHHLGNATQYSIRHPHLSAKSHAWNLSQLAPAYRQEAQSSQNEGMDNDQENEME